MPVQIQAPDGSIAEFPDGMADADIERVMQQHYPAPAVKPPSWWDMLSGSSNATAYSRQNDPRLAAEAQRQGTTPQELGGRHEGYAGEFLKGVPIAGAAMPQTQQMTRVEQQFPGSSAGARVMGGMTATAPLMAAAPAAMGVTGGLGARAAASGLSGAAMSGADQAAREALGPVSGQPIPNPPAMLKALGLPNTGNRTADAALTGGIVGPAATMLGSGLSAALSPAITRSAQLLKSAGVKLSPGQQLGGAANQFGGIAAAVPFSGMGAVRAEGIPSFNRAAENMALKPANIPELAPYIHTEIPATWEEAAKKATPSTVSPVPVAQATAANTPDIGGLPSVEGLGPLGKVRQQATHAMEITHGDGSRMLLEGTPEELAAAKAQQGPGAGASGISPKSSWIGASMPMRRAPPLPPGEAAQLPPNSEFRGNAVAGGPMGAPGQQPQPPGFVHPDFPHEQFKGNLQSDMAPDFIAARTGTLPEDVQEAGAALGRNGSIMPGFQGREFVRKQINGAYNIALNGAPGEPTPYLLARTPQLANIRSIDMPGVKPETAQTYQAILDRHIFSRFQPVRSGAPDSNLSAWTIDGPSLSNGFREIDKIATAARRRGGDGYDLSTALAGAKSSLMNSLKAQEPQTAARLKAADDMWSHYAELRASGVRAKDDMNGQFTPQQLNAGSAAADKSQFKLSTSEGRTQYGDFARAGMDVGLAKPHEPTGMEKLGVLGGAAAVGAETGGWGLAAFPAMWAYSSRSGQAAANAYLSALGNYGQPLRQGLSQGIPPAFLALSRNATQGQH